MLVVQTKPPWKCIEFFKSPIFFQFNSSQQEFPCPVPESGEWPDSTPPDLIVLKNGIGEKEQEDNWDLAKRVTNPYELIFTNSKHVELPQSVSIIKPLSRSFFKLVEILEITKFFETVKPTKYRTLHLCEGPGGFIEAFVDRAKLYKKNIHSIYAMTLKQTNHNIPGWRAASRFLARHPEIHIEYGPSLTGDIMVKENQDYLSAKMNHLVHLVTSDGGFDFSIDFGAQEKLVFPLLVASAFIALSCLAPGGMFVLKIFDSHSPVTQQFIAFLAVHFREFTIYKPVTSRPCNSERYFLGIGFRNFPKESIAAFQELMVQTNEIKSIWDNPISNKIIKDITPTMEKYVDEQKIALQRVLAFPISPNKSELNGWWSEQEKLCMQWCQAFHIPWRQI
jgi:23S rRNA U2552 (ribose-2'-O)-methylase RlmE/FtsJ